MPPSIPASRLVVSMQRMERFVLGSSESTRATRLEHARARGSTPQLVRAFAPSLGADGATPATMHVIVHKKLKRAELARRGIRAVPRSVGRMPTRVFESAALTASASPGDLAKHALSQEFGSLLCVLNRNGQSWIVSASHVLAPSAVSAQVGDNEMVGTTLGGQLLDWDRLEAGASTASDVAVASTSFPDTTAWRDATPFAGTRDYDPANGPFTVFGAVTSTVSGSGDAIRSSPLSIDVSGVGTVSYTSVALLAFATSPGDSGAPVRDSGGFLVGMAVGGTQTGKTAMTPWQTLGPAIDALVA